VVCGIGRQWQLSPGREDGGQVKTRIHARIILQSSFPWIVASAQSGQNPGSLDDLCPEPDMVSLTTPVCDFGWPAPAFDLPGTDGRQHTLASAMGPNGLLVMFICNHCPYVKAIRPRLLQDLRELRDAFGIHAIGIMSNDSSAYAEDSFEQMTAIARAENFPFPYVLDTDQSVARAYGAVCTPDFFGFNRDLRLQYRGRFDASRKESAPADARRDLFEAMQIVARTQTGPTGQIPSMGCSIKWIGE
jgi:peroxiredoxin